MINIRRPYLPEKGGIRFRDKTLASLQVSASKHHIVDGKKKLVRTSETVKLEPFTDEKTFNISFKKALAEAETKKRALDAKVSSKGAGVLRNSKVAKIGTFGAALDALWNSQYSKQEQTANTKIYIKDVLNFFDKNKKLNSFDIEQIDEFKVHIKNVIENRTHCGSGTVANSSINKRLGVIRETFRYALKHRMMNNDDLPNPDVRKKNMGVEDLSRSEPSIKPMLNVQEESQLIQQARDNGDEEYADALIWLFDTGMRHDGELNVIKYSDVNLKSKSISFQRRKTGGNWSVIPLTQRCLEVVKRRSKFALANGGRLWTYTRGQLRHKWDLVRRMAGLPKKFSSYCTRHTCCTRLVESGLPANVVKDWMGHKSVITSLTYYAKSSPKLLDKAVNALETYNQECDATVGDVIPMLGHNSRNKEKTKK